VLTPIFSTSGRQRISAARIGGGLAGHRCLNWKQVELDGRIGNFNRFFGICGGAAKFPHPRIQSGQRFGATRHGLLERPSDLDNLPAIQIGGEHSPRPVHQIMGFIHEEAVLAAALGEVPAQINLGIKKT